MPAHVVIVALTILSLMVPAQQKRTTSIPIEFLSEGSAVHGNFFPADGPAAATLLLLPGWPGSANDVLGLGVLLAGEGVNVMMFNPRGLHASEGVATFANTLADIGAALRWLDRPDVQKQFKVDSARLALGGHSYGGGMAVAYAARDPRVRRVISIAGNDHGEFVRQYQRDPAFAEGIRRMLASTRAPEGPARFDMDASLRELSEHQDIYGLREGAPNLADRSILLIGGWEDLKVTVDQYMLPLYRALKRAGAADVTFLVYHDGHNFGTVREQLASDIRGWLVRDGRP